MKGLYKNIKGEGGHPQTESRTKPQTRSLQETHQEILTNLMSTIIGKPTIVEAQRVLKVMDSLLLNLETFIYLDAEFVGRFQDLNKGKLHKDLVNQLSPETLKLLVRQAEIEQKYRPYANLDQAIKEGEEVDEQKKVESERLEKMLSDNFKNVLRQVQGTQHDYEIIKQLKNNVNGELNDLVHCVKCMKIIMLKKLSTAAEEEENHTRQLQELKEKVQIYYLSNNPQIQSYEKTKNQCEQDLQKLRMERNKHTNEKKEEIDKLKNSIQVVKQEKQKRQEMLARESKQKVDTLEKEHKVREDKLTQELTALRQTFSKQKDDNSNEENQLKRRKTASDQLLTEAISVYDNMMDEKTLFKMELMSECQTIEKQLKDKIEYFRVVDGERAREKILEEEFKRKKDQFEIQKNRKWEAAKHIQAFFKSLKKPKKGKKGGKKKK